MKETLTQPRQHVHLHFPIHASYLSYQFLRLGADGVTVQHCQSFHRGTEKVEENRRQIQREEMHDRRVY